jgi:hypothetical protein
VNKDVRERVGITSYEIVGIRLEGHISAISRDGGRIAVAASFSAA